MSKLLEAVAIPLTAFWIAVLLMPLLNRAAVRLGFVDHPNARKIHVKPIPLLGGLGVYAGVIMTLLLWSEMDGPLIGMMLASFLVMLLGIADDHLDLHSRYRLMVHVVLALGLSVSGVRFHLFAVEWLNHLVTVLWIVGVINAMNCMDCADGAAGGTCAIVFAALAAIAASNGRHFICQASLSAMGGVLGFLIYNRPPARVFLGDSGSTFLGLMAAVIVILAGPKGAPPGSFPLPALVLCIPVLDIIWVHFRRYRAGIRSMRDLLASTGKDHLPHRLMAHGYSKTACMGTVMLFSALSAEGVYGLSQGLWMGGIAAFAALGAALWFLEENMQVALRPEDQVAICLRRPVHPFGATAPWPGEDGIDLQRHEQGIASAQPVHSSAGSV